MCLLTLLCCDCPANILYILIYKCVCMCGRVCYCMRVNKNDVFSICVTGKSSTVKDYT